MAGELSKAPVEPDVGAATLCHALTNKRIPVTSATTCLAMYSVHFVLIEKVKNGRRGGIDGLKSGQ